jgi:eukaryotic-like serine/threonine-protein kinase
MSHDSRSAEDTVAATLASGTAEAETDRVRARTTGSSLGPGDLVGRYVVLAKLGAGGMGVVYSAHDPDLDRKVALKLLLPGRGGSEGRSRLLREAQALAKLQHPNVVTIHDVGEHEERVWLAMEYVDGKTLGGWLDEQPRSWPEVLDVLSTAGRGVAAAHDAGLLHRDLKPDNIMVASDGQVRVMDFGLARSRKSGVIESGSTLVKAPELELELSLTRSGTLLGTPGYMSPEQFREEELGPATDQFSYCVTLWEALWGERPFVGKTLMEVMVAVLEGELTAPTHRGTKVPGWLRRILERGLSGDPEARWPSMQALLDALARGQRQARLHRGLGVAGALGLCAAAFVGWQAVDRHNRVMDCESAGSSIAQVWNDEAREELHAALVGTGVARAEATADKVMPWLDDHARAWQAARTDACLDAQVHGAWDEDTYDRSLWCLDERRMELEALVVELSRGDLGSVDKAVPAAVALGAIAPCRDRDLLSRTPSTPEEHRDSVRAVRAELSRVAALQRVGLYDEGLRRSRDALEVAETIGWLPLVAAARLALGELLQKTGAYAEAEEALETAYFEAATAGAVEVATTTAQQLAFTVGYELARPVEGLRWSKLAEVTLASIPDPAGTRRATQLAYVALVYDAMGSYEIAMALHERALADWEQALGPDHPHVATTLNNLAGDHQIEGSYEDARKLHERALTIREKVLGPDHPHVAESLSNLAAVHSTTNSHDEAKTLNERALAIREKALGPDHPRVATSLNNLGAAHHATGSYEDARVLHERALAIREKVLGSDHPHVATSLNNLGLVHQATGSFEEAKALHERALAIWEAALEPGHPDVVESMNELAIVHEALGAYEDAATLYDRVLELREKTLGPEHPDVGFSLLRRARVALAQHLAHEAVPLAERSVRVLENAGAPAKELTVARSVLAQALSAAALERTTASR